MHVVPGGSSGAWGDGANAALAEVLPRSAGLNLYLGASVLTLAA